MIRITIDPEGKNFEQEFEATSIVLGPDDGTGIDLVVEEDLGIDWRVSVIQAEGRHFAVCEPTRNDITLDGTPFEKEEIGGASELRIGGTLIQLSSALAEPEEDEEEIQERAVEAPGQSIPLSELDVDAELARINEIFAGEESSSTTDVDALLSDESLEKLLEEAESIDLSAIDIPEEPEPQSEPEPISEAELEPATQEDVVNEAAEVIETSEDEASSQPTVPDVEVRDDVPDTELQEAAGTSAPATQRVGDSEESVAPAPPEQVKGREEEAFEEAIIRSTADWRDLEAPVSAETKSDKDEVTQAVPEDDYTYTGRGRSRGNRPPLPTFVYATAAALCILICVAAIWAYRDTRRSAHHERLALTASTDLAMSLMHAQGRVTSLTSKDILSPEFIHLHMTEVIAEPYLTSAPFLRQRETLLESYEFRVFSTRNLERFLVWAKPRTSSFSFTAPTAEFVIYSADMEIKRISLKDQWNELLDSDVSFEKLDTRELTELLGSEENVRLNSLDSTYLSGGFTPPRELAYRSMSSDASERIYNAPRYFPLTQPIITALENPNRVMANAKRRLEVERTLRKLNSYPGLVVYTTEDVDTALQLQAKLQTYWPEYPFTLGVVDIDLTTSIPRDVRLLEQPKGQALTATLENAKQLPSREQALANEADPNDPLFISLGELAGERRNALEAISGELISLMQAHNERESAEFYAQYENILSRYIEESRAKKEKITRVLGSLERESRERDSVNGPIEFMAQVYAHKLDDFLPEELRRQTPAESGTQTVPSIEFSEQPSDLELAMQAVTESDELATLHPAVLKAANAIGLLRSNGSEAEASQWRVQLREGTLKKIQQLLLAPDPTRSVTLFQSDDRQLLADILSSARITEQEERDFFLNEFDRLIARYQRVAHQETQLLEVAKERTETALAEIPISKTNEKSELKEELEAIEKELKSRRASARAMADNITSIPLDVATTDFKSQQLNSARLGQQILLQARTEQPGGERDQRLLEAITLLSAGTEDNRALWSEILEARRLLSETPQSQLSAALGSDLGLTANQANRQIEIRRLWHDYVTELTRLSTIADSQQYDAQFRVFRDEAATTLARLAKLGREVEEEASETRTALADYIQALKTFEEDYNRAKASGFFARNRGYHQRMLSRLRGKIRRLNSVVSSYEETCEQLSAVGTEAARLAASELEVMSAGTPPSRDHATAIRRKLSNALDSKPMSASAVRSLRRALGIKVLPAPE